MSIALGGGVKWDASNHCSEREPGPWTNCVPASINMLAQANLEPIPSTNDWADRFRKKAGYPESGATSIRGFAVAFKDTFGYAYRVAAPVDPFLLVQPGYSAAIIGKNSAFKSTAPWRKWDPGFDGYHCVFISQLPDRRVLMDDPLAPEGTYSGMFVTKDEVRAFYAAAGGAKEIGYLKTGTDAGTVNVPPVPPVVVPAPPVVVIPPTMYTQAQLDAAVDAARRDVMARAHVDPAARILY